MAAVAETSVDAARLASAKARTRTALQQARRAGQSLAEAERLLGCNIAAAFALGPDDNLTELDLEGLLQTAREEYPGAILDCVIMARLPGGEHEEVQHDQEVQS